MHREEYRLTIRDHLRSAYLLSDARIDAILPRFLAALESLMNDLEGLSGAGNIRELSRAGHAMKGALLNLGLQQLAEKAGAIEKCDPLQTDRTAAAQLVADLRKELDKII